MSNGIVKLSHPKSKVQIQVPASQVSNAERNGWVVIKKVDNAKKVVKDGKSKR